MKPPKSSIYVIYNMDILEVSYFKLTPHMGNARNNKKYKKTTDYIKGSSSHPNLMISFSFNNKLKSIIGKYAAHIH
jgi:hypothetical protein